MTLFKTFTNRSVWAILAALTLLVASFGTATAAPSLLLSSSDSTTTAESTPEPPDPPSDDMTHWIAEQESCDDWTVDAWLQHGAAEDYGLWYGLYQVDHDPYRETLIYELGYLQPGEAVEMSNVDVMPIEPGTTAYIYFVDGNDAQVTDAATYLPCSEPPVNSPPVVEDLELTTEQDTAVSGTVNASDPDEDDELSYVFSGATNGSVTHMGASFTYTPNPGWYGVDSFTMTATDPGGLYDSGTTTINVTEAEEPPPVDPAGVSVYDTSQCEVLVLGEPTGLQPADASWQYFNDAEMIGVGENSVAPGDYTLTLDVNGVTVDSDSISIQSCGYEPEPPVRDYLRWGGVDRYDTAALIALNGNWEPDGTVYIATGQDMPDALAMAGASMGVGASVSAVGVTVDGPPILLVKQGQIPQVTRAALDQLDPSHIVVAGSSAAVSTEVERQLGAWAPVERLGGADRYETASKIATQADHDVVYLASGEVFADALTAGPWSRWTGGAILLAKQDALPAVTGGALAEVQPARLVVVGGSDRVSDSVAQAAAEAAGLGGFERIAGANRYETSQLVAMSFPKDVPTSTLVIATGVDYPDALTAGAYAGNQGGPVVLTRPNSLPAGTAAAAQWRPGEQVVLVGGSNAVSPDVFDLLPSLFE